MFEPEVLQSLKIFVYRDLKMHTPNCSNEVSPKDWFPSSQSHGVLLGGRGRPVLPLTSAPH